MRGRNIDRFLSRVFVRGCVSIKWHIMGYDRENVGMIGIASPRSGEIQENMGGIDQKKERCIGEKLDLHQT